MVLHLPAQGLEELDEHLPMLSCGAWLTLPLPYWRWRIDTKVGDGRSLSGVAANAEKVKCSVSTF